MKNAKISYKLLFIVSVIILAAFLVPLIVVGGYAVPCADDYSYGFEAHRIFTQTGSVWKAVLRGLEHVGEVYEIWQGTYSAIFLFSVQPAVFSEKLYFLTGIIMLFSLSIGIFALCLSLLPAVFKLKKTAAGLIACAVTIACTQLLPSPVQGFFWYNGSVYYTFFYGLSLIAFALGISYVNQGGAAKGSILCLLCAVLGGGNFVTVLNCVIIAVSTLALLVFFKNRAWKRLLLPLSVLLIGFAISIAAPGNALRQATVTAHPGAIEAVFMSFKECAKYSASWFSLPLIAMLLAISPLLWHSAAASPFSFRLPLVLTVYSFCVLAAMFCPPIYALGNVGEFRLVNIIYFAFVLLAVLNLFYWLGWAAKRLKKTAVSSDSLPLLPTVCALAVSGALCLFAMFNGSGFSSVAALGILRSGEAQAFKACADTRLEILLDKTIADAELPDYPSQPYLLFYDDISPDPSAWQNVDMASFYGKSSVKLSAGK